MIDILDDIKDLVFGNSRLTQIKEFSNIHKFGYSRRVNMDNLPIEFKGMEFFQGERKKSIKGFLYRPEMNESVMGYIYDFLYFSEFGKKTTTIFHFKFERLKLPYFIVKPKTGINKLGSIFSSSEWSELNKQFDNQFSVGSEDMNFMRMNLTIQFAEIMNDLTSFIVEGKGNHLLLYEKNKSVKTDDYMEKYNKGLELLDIILN